MKYPSSVYLDSNALIGICDGRNEPLRIFMESALDTGLYIAPFSAEQIDELTSADESPQSKSRLEYLAKISRNIYFCNSVTGLGFMARTPFDVHQTINEVRLPIQGHEILEGIAPYDQRRQARSSLGLDPNTLNNMKGQQAVATIDKALSRLVPVGQDAPRSLRELLNFSRRFAPEAPRGFGKPSSETVCSEERNYEICALFSMLDSFGFWPDDAKVSKRGSGFADGRHVFNASYYYALVSEDRKLRGRAEAVYDVLKIHTRVLSTKEFMRRDLPDAG